MSTEPKSAGVKRRDFLKVVGAAGATTAMIGCGTDHVEKLVPYLVHPDQTVPGVSSYYATTCRECAAACGVIAETRDGRAIKLEGNPAHPVNRGALCARGQAALQGLYNPDRIRTPLLRQGNALQPATWDAALQRLSQEIARARAANAGGVAFLNQHETGSFPALLDQWLAGQGFPAHLSIDADADLAAIAAHRAAYGVAWPRYDFGAARLVVSFGADFLDTWGPTVPQQLDWADARAKLAGAPRLVYVGARRSLTGLNADEWIPAKPGTELAIAQLLGGSGDVAAVAQAAGVDVAQLTRLVEEVRSARPAVALAGGHGAYGYDLATTVARLNGTLGAVGTVVRPDAAYTGFEGIASHAELRAVADRMKAGQVPLLMVRGVNPVYSSPAALGFAEAMTRVPFKVSFSSYRDETTELCDLVLPDHHPLESWGDAQPVRGTIGLQQPVMDPVFDTRATADVILQLQAGAGAAAAPAAATTPGAAATATTATAAGRVTDFRSQLISRFPGGAQAFATSLAGGLAPGSIPARPARTAAPAPSTPIQNLEGTQGDFYLVVYPSPVLGGDGRGGNKPWLQELPDPVTKICWQSWVEIHPETARRLGVASGDLLRVETAGGNLTAPAHIYMGVRPDTVAVATGRGHTAYGRYAKDVGVNPLAILPATENGAGALALTSTKARVSRSGDHVMLVTTEGSARQHGRGIAQALIASELGTVEGTGAERASEIAPQGDQGTPAGAGVTGPTPQSSSGTSTEQGSGGGHGQPGQAGAVAGAAAAGHGAGETPAAAGQGGGHGGGHSFVGDASHEYLPGLRSPVANDAQGDFGDPKSKDKGMYDPEHWSGMAKRRWAMAIDLARCTGCSACITACYAENNIPTVGAPWQGSQVLPDRTGPGANILRSREMTWIRLERYYEGAEHEDGRFDPQFEARFVPMLCQHCGNAPCEPVCPVYATYHAPDGLNVQVYNRCVGTRYCSNNCPYKVRYFNWFGYGEPDRAQYAFPEPLHMQLNPDVTVRAKGVMEKCTFCVQRIREAENRVRSEGRELQPDEFTVACAQACPSRAIVFGDAADAGWSISRYVGDQRAYHVFEELNTYTAVVYLKKVNHPGPGQVARPAQTAQPAGEAH